MAEGHGHGAETKSEASGDNGFEIKDIFGVTLLKKFLDKTITSPKSLRAFVEQFGKLAGSATLKFLEDLGSVLPNITNLGSKSLGGGGGGGHGAAAHAH